MLRVDLKTGRDVLSQATQEEVRDFDPQVVFHLAAHHYIPWTEEHPRETQILNVEGTAMMLEAMGPSLEAFVLASSAAVYGYDASPFQERHPLNGTSVYANSKKDAEVELRNFAGHRVGVRCAAARLFNVVGVGDEWPHVLPEIVRHLQDEIVVGNTWPMRDYVHVRDAADALEFLAEKAPYRFSAWNVSTGVGTTVTSLIRRVQDKAISAAPVRVQPGRFHDGHLIGDPGLLRLIGWCPTRTVDDAIGDLLDADT